MVKAMNRNSHALRNAAVIILGLLALSAAALLRFPGSEVEVYGNFSPDDLSQIKHEALRHTRGVALGNLRRSILKPKLLPGALRDVLTCSVCSIDRCWNKEVSVNTGSPWIGCLVLISSNGEWCVQGSSTFPPPREPVPDADPSRRHPVSISVPTGLRSTRKGNAFDYVFTGFETARLTVGHKMITGVSEEVDSNKGTSILSSYGNPFTAGFLLVWDKWSGRNQAKDQAAHATANLVKSEA
jgi:hypothetical protein